MARDWSKPTLSRPAAGAQTLYTLVVDAGFVLMIAPVLRALGRRLYTLPALAAWALVIGVAAGLGFSWWARWRLGRNWSWSVTLKADHAIIETGPYRFVRHPIYTGLIVAGVCTAALEGKALSMAGCALMVAGLWIKARLEERFLGEELGEDYRAYARRTGMLLPGM
jgi:protein-S-isoprenylcysteine O-methyltransferase Ste14